MLFHLDTAHGASLAHLGDTAGRNKSVWGAEPQGARALESRTWRTAVCSPSTSPGPPAIRPVEFRNRTDLVLVTLIDDRAGLDLSTLRMKSNYATIIPAARRLRSLTVIRFAIAGGSGPMGPLFVRFLVTDARSGSRPRQFLLTIRSNAIVDWVGNPLDGEFAGPSLPETYGEAVISWPREHSASHEEDRDQRGASRRDEASARMIKVAWDARRNSPCRGCEAVIDYKVKLTRSIGSNRG
jgi:hypothetical protein